MFADGYISVVQGICIFLYAQFMAYMLTECYVSVVQVVYVCDAHCPEQVHGPVFIVGYISVA